MNRTLAPSAGSPIGYFDAPGFQTYWGADARLMTAAMLKVGKIGKVE